MTATPHSTELPAPRGGLAVGHVVLAGLLGLLAAVVGAPLLGASLFGGWPAVMVSAGGLVCLSSAGAAALDRAAGPGAVGRPGSVVRGLVVGGLGSAVALAGAFWGLHSDVVDRLPVPVLVAAAALPFPVLAGLQWPGAARAVSSVLLVGGVAAVVVPGALQAAEEEQTERILTEVGTLEHPWVSEVEGYRLGPSQATGSPFIWTDLDPVAGPAEDGLQLFRDRPVHAGEPDPCAQFSFYTPEGDHPMTACTPLGDRTWLRSTGSWQELSRHDPDARVGVMARPGVSLEALQEALDAARPMTDDEYESWLDDGLTPGW
ncbi:hypothetical protein SAMN05660485_02977 [Blastococcus fimeti]|nr:hypothetical protein SAMN05660485_02977 [Blastococcus fimeti]